MHNGQASGAAPAVQINPADAANVALKFLSRADLKPHERGEFSIVEQFLLAIAQGRVVIGPPPPQLEAAQVDDRPAETPH